MKLTLVEKKDEAEGTKSFFFKPEHPISYLAGQYFYYTIPTLKYPDPKGTTRHFTISSSPTEGENLRLTTRVRQESGFKKTLDELPLSSELDGEGPNGTFILDESVKGPQVFLAGGIGITPVRSMLKYAVDKNLNIPLHLIYSNSTVEQITFRQELEEWAKTHPNIKIDMTISKPEESKSPWNGIVGRIDDALIAKLVPDFASSTFWVCGPPAMVDAMEEALEKLKVPQHQIKIEKFTGY